MVGLTDENHQPSLWEERVRPDEGFWASLRNHPVPVREEAIQAIGTRSSRRWISTSGSPIASMRWLSPHPSPGRRSKANLGRVTAQAET